MATCRSATRTKSIMQPQPPVRRTASALVIAMAMVETEHMSASEHDNSKGGAMECLSAFNLNRELLETLKKQTGQKVDTSNLKRLNSDDNMEEAVSYLVEALHHWGVIDTLNFHRGGAAALGQSAASSSVEVYRNGLQLIFNKVCFEDRELQTDDRRVVVD